MTTENPLDAFATQPFRLGPIPELVFGAGEVKKIADHAAALRASGGEAPILLIADATLAEMDATAPVAEALGAAGATVEVHAEIAGEPKAADIDAAAERVRMTGPGLVVAMGGGSAIDAAKIAAAVAASKEGVLHYKLGENPLPRRQMPMIAVPTTAGTGAEVTATAVFAGPDGKKLWVHDAAAKPDVVILDPETTVSLPATLTAWTGLDAFVHALEACTNRRRFAAADMHSFLALQLIAGALETAVKTPTDLAARGRLLLGAAYAGIGIDACGTAIAHTISHALSGLGPIHHGFATALGLDATLAWSVEEDDGRFARAARACGLDNAAALPGWFSGLMAACGVEKRLPESFKEKTAGDLADEMRLPANAPMREATARTVTDADIDAFAARIMDLA
ncbi:iron-containing alcohol dehydrogenase [Rhodobium gokarnense]|uniref:Alcohol dehydrogenase class IV n=1 Tax=Rhodobium gokarnense TaxID=364296 RepID=A0ABT3H7X7_9HYPH|nr:iron-containing alcohol dehydrogenase [Rhodobium gokarnense]MCW2306497.1 alcohol dehydrogenase class IV [Rhodobium gokarnense]